MLADFPTVTERVKKALKLEDDKALAAALGMKTNAFYNRRRSESLPYDALIDLIDKHKMCADWVFFGLGQPFRRPDPDQKFQVGLVDTRRFQDVCSEVEAALSAESLSGEDLADARTRAALFGGIAAYIYNRVAFIKGDGARATAIRSEAKAMAGTLQLAEDAKQIMKKPSAR